MKTEIIQYADPLVSIPTLREENAVQQRLRSILEYWGPDGANWCAGYANASGAHCVIGVKHATFWNSPANEWPGFGFLKKAAIEAGQKDMLGAVAKCSDSSFYNARKMVLRAIELAA